EAAGRPALARKKRLRMDEVLRRELARQPPNAGALNSLAWSCAMYNQELPDALLAAQRAVALSPRDVNNLDTLAEVHFRMGHVDPAIAIETRVLAMNPMMQDFKDHLARYRKRK